ncbi:MAG: germination protein YpeB [Clostridia bacterium]|nr:germination protein YpeB [Clostridia bacterium]
MSYRKGRIFHWVTGVVIGVLAITSIVGVYQYKRAKDLALAVENQYVHSFHELTDYVKDVEVLLQKAMLVSDPKQMAALSSEIYMQTAAAKSNLAQLPVSELNLTGTSKFLSQAGDYTSFLAGKTIQEEVITEDEFLNLSQLAACASGVSQHLEELENQLYAKNLTLKEAVGMTAYADEGDFLSGMEGMEDAFQDYPSLIYDGPFSEHIEDMKPLMLSEEKVITEEEALSKAKAFVPFNWREKLSYAGESSGTIATYDFTAKGERGREISIGVTKHGGYVLYMLDSRSVSKEILSVNQAMQHAQMFLKEMGYEFMESSYYEKTGNVATINFAAAQDGVILYSDLIKVKVALDNGEILGFESRGYLMSHAKRNFSEVVLSREDAKKKLNKHLSIDTVRLALIPLDSRREVLTYECKGTFGDKNFLIYINAETGREEKIFMLIESEDGILTV